MIVDRCKPLNVGENDTVRITVSIGEAARLFRDVRGLPNEALRDFAACLRRCLKADKKRKVKGVK